MKLSSVPVLAIAVFVGLSQQTFEQPLLFIADFAFGNLSVAVGVKLLKEGRNVLRGGLRLLLLLGGDESGRGEGR